jgi:hypothetical protein
MKKYSFLVRFLSSVTWITTAPLSAPSIQMETIVETSLPIEVQTACIQYLNKKLAHYTVPLRTVLVNSAYTVLLPDPYGQNNKLTATQLWWKRQDAYAFTPGAPYNRTIYLSPAMIHSIQTDLQKTGTLSAYNRFVLLHEMGHVLPYGFAPSQLEKHNTGNWLSGIFMYSIGTIGSMILLIAMIEEYRDTPVHLVIALCLATQLTGWGTSGLLKAGKLSEHTRALEEDFQKKTFVCSDPEFKKHFTRFLEERDADLFAIQHLDTNELQELYDFLQIYGADTKTFIERTHLCKAERQEAILKELTYRKSHSCSL